MSSQLKHRQRVENFGPVRTARQAAIVRRTSGAGVHRDQDWRRGGKSARGGRNGERAQLRREV